ncbi:MAG: peptide deformylase [Clostridia bacterium]|nr:peptide deformylase [Clostridia bacterium]MBO7178598.1 peptide deformylase [Clostridia bacterium]
MAIRNIFKEGEPILRKRAREVEVFDARLHQLLDDMKETLHVAEGVGLAAPQVGISKRVVIIEPTEGDITEMINPVITKAKGSQIGLEGCLSVDSSKNGKVNRPMSLTVEYFDRNGEKQVMKATDWTARIICHETDHLDGILFIDKKEKEGKR